MKNYTASIAIQVVPSVETGNIRPVVRKVLEYIKGCGFNYFIGPYETTIDADFDSLIEIIKQCQKICIKAGAPSCMTYIKMVYKPDGGVWLIDEKVSKHHNEGEDKNE